MRVAVLACLLAACGTTRIVAGDPGALILVDGEVAGRGSAELTKRGLPSRFEVEVRFPDGSVAWRHLSRRLTAATLLAGLFTYGVGLVTVWELPDEVLIPTPAAADDPWMRPPAAALSSSAW